MLSRNEPGSVPSPPPAVAAPPPPAVGASFGAGGSGRQPDRALAAGGGAVPGAINNDPALSVIYWNLFCRPSKEIGSGKIKEH